MLYMLHGIINEHGNCLNVTYGISEKYYFNMFSFKSLACGVLILGLIFIADKKPMD